LIPLSDISSIELLDSNFNKIDINNLADAITIKIPISQALINSLKANETIQPMYYNATTNKWSTLGITSIVQTSEYVIFQVNHLTDFALFKISAINETPVMDTPPTDTPIVVDPAPSASGGGGGCAYVQNSSMQPSNFLIMIVFFAFYLFRKKAQRKKFKDNFNNKT
jgi:hypothetical protein